MKNLVKNIILFFTVFLTYNQIANAESVKINQILKTSKSWNGADLPGFGSGTAELRVLSFKIAPGAKTSIHIHPLNGAGYMLAGELTMFTTEDIHGSFEDRSKVKEIKIKAGEAWAETVNTWHYGENKGDKDAEFIVVFAGQQNTPPTLAAPSSGK